MLDLMQGYIEILSPQIITEVPWWNFRHSISFSGKVHTVREDHMKPDHRGSVSVLLGLAYFHLISLFAYMLFQFHPVAVTNTVTKSFSGKNDLFQLAGHSPSLTAVRSGTQSRNHEESKLHDG